MFKRLKEILQRQYYLELIMKQILTILFLLSFAFINATIINVPVPYATIQAGINAAANADTVLVQPYTYFETINYNGKLITVGSLFLTTQDTSYISLTVIDGNSSGSVVTFENGEGLAAILAGFTITNGSASNGGGIYCEESSPTLHGLIISGNSASNNGGGISCFESCYPRLENVTITENIASDSGGGISCVIACNPSLENVTISGNTAQYSGAGIYCFEDSYPSLENVTISDNYTQGNGGGIYCEFSSSPSLLNTIMWNNSQQEIYIAAGGSITVTYSNIEGGWTGVGNIDSDPLFVDAGGGDFHLQAASPCIDVGDPNPQYNDPDGTRNDMGAYYFNQYNGPIWHISTTGSDIYGSGTEQFPFATIQNGINRSSDTDTVLVQPGTYVENINYNGKLITVASLFLTTADTSYVSTTIIDGNASGSVVTFNNGENSASVLSGFSIINGDNNRGGGIYCISSSPYLNHVTISGNSASVSSYPYGGGIYCNGSSPYLNHVTISGNSVSGIANYGNGGGIYCVYSSNPNMQNVTISGNSANGYGGGILCSSSSNPNLENVTIVSNSANEYGGGICCFSSNPSMQNVAITDNYSSQRGGGVYCSDSNPILQNVTITGNTGVPGGGIYCYDSNLVLKNSILWNNQPQEIIIYTGSVTATYSNIEGGWAGAGNIDSDPLFADPGSEDYHLSWANFPIPDATMSPCIDTGDPFSPLDPDGTIADMGAYYFDKSPGVPVITSVEDVPNDQGRYVQVIWDRSIYDPVAIGSYSIWRYDDVFGDRGIFDVYEDPQEIFEIAARNSEKDYYWQRNGEILTFITQLPAMGFAQYSVIATTLKDSSIVSTNYSTFKVFAHTEVTAVYFSSLPDSGYSVDNIAPDETRVYIAQNGSNMNINWDEVEYGTYQGNSYPEINGVWYKIYAGDSPDFVCDEAHLIDTVTNLNYNYPLTGEEKKFFKIVVSDQP